MPFGAIASGFGSAISDYIKTERDRRRVDEDKYLDKQIAMISELIKSPNANQHIDVIGSALNDIMEMEGAKLGTRKQKKGKEGFFGSTELPISQFLRGIYTGTRPIQGPTHESIAQPNIERPYSSSMGELGETGEEQFAQSIPQAPIRRPVAVQPLLRSPQEMAEEAGQLEAARYRGRNTGENEADRANMVAAGLTPEEIHDAMLRKFSGTGRDQFQPYNFLMPGETIPKTFEYNKATGLWDTPDGRRPQGHLVGVGPTNRLRYDVDDRGTVSGMSVNAFDPNLVQSIPIVPGQQGRTSPDPTPIVIQGPNGAPIVARPNRQGSGVTTMDIAVPGGSGLPNAPGNPQPPQRTPVVSYRPPSQGTLDALNAAESGLQVLSKLKATWKPEYTGIIGGRARAFNEKYNPFSEADPLYRQFQQRWVTSRNELLRANAGLTQTLTEKENTEAQIMSLNDKDANFLPALQVLEEHFTRKIEAMQRNSGMGVPFVGRIPNAPGQNAAPQLQIGQPVLYQGRTLYFKGYDAQGKKILEATP